jgi:diguanylate cyclase (GGDEF)-like protein
VFVISLNEHEVIYLDSVEENLDALTSTVADELLIALSSEEQSHLTVNRILLTFKKYKHIINANVYDANWQKIEHFINADNIERASPLAQLSPIITDPSQLPMQLSRHDNLLICIKPIGDPESPIGYIQVINDVKKPIDMSRHDLLVTAIPIVLLVLFISLIITWYTFKRVLTPLIDLSNFTHLVKKTRDYTLRHNVDGSDEVANLCQDINSMLIMINKENTLNKEQNKILLEQQESMYQLANFDLLTGLPNRRNIIDNLARHLELAKRGQKDVAILFFDVDGFKSINDRMGHETGDKLLIRIARDAEKCLARQDILARLAGDEFLMVLPDLEQRDDATKVAKTVLRQLQAPVQIDKWEIHTGVSIGIAFASESSFDVDTLISHADVAMYVSKKNGKGTFTVFQREMLILQRRKTQIINLIPMALENEEFNLVYQPKISRNGKVNQFEALLRWNSAEIGMVSPAEFIPIAESGGRIGDITRWVIRQVIKDLDKMKEICSDDCVVSLNVSSKDLMTPYLKEYVVDTLSQYQHDISSLQFEITESSYLEEFDLANQFFSGIREIGGTIALDDFGTGYSSLSYLTRIQIDTLKIDRQFVLNSLTSSQDAYVLNSILALSKQLGLYSCCEGIETAEHARYLIEQGCDSLQGFYFSRPVVLEDLAEAIENVHVQYLAIDQDCNRNPPKLIEVIR